MKELETAVMDAIAHHSGEKKEKLTPGTQLFDLNVDSLDFASIVIEIEAEADVRIPDAVFGLKNPTIKQMIEFVRHHNASKYETL